MGMYFFTNQYHYQLPQQLPLTEWEAELPLVSETIWIYLAAFPMMYLPLFVLNDLEALNRYAVSFVIVCFCAAMAFYFSPVAYPRGLWSFDNPVGIHEWALHLFRGIDAPTNSFPSLHVAEVFLAARALKARGKAAYAFGGFWFVAISISTLTTKQHYIADILGGLILALAVEAFVAKYIRLQDVATSSATERTS